MLNANVNKLIFYMFSKNYAVQREQANDGNAYFAVINFSHNQFTCVKN